MMGHQIVNVWVILAVALTFSSAFEVRTGRILNHRNSVCSSWGNFHYKTFDGDIYRFPGTCSYNFASDCHNSYHEFSVHIQRSIANGHPLIHKILIKIKEVVIELRNNTERVNGIIPEIPYYSYDITMVKNDAYIKVYTKIGLTLMWNQQDAVMLELESKFNNRTCGLCGDYNGMPINNEFLFGDIRLTPVQFGNLQKVQYPDVLCSDSDETKKTDTYSCSRFYSVCKRHLEGPAFSNCRQVMRLSNYIQSCMLDMCACEHNNDQFCLCSSITEFSRQCSHAGGQPGNWRTSKFCSRLCPGNMVYQESGSPCISTCSHLKINSLCEEHNMDGCFCPEGTVKDDYNGKGCIPVSECYCKHQERLYEPGQTIQNDCDECTCVSGRWNCKHGTCPQTCSIEGGAHFTTFDGKVYTFHGNCYYIISEMEGNDDENYAILGELTPCSTSEKDTCLKTITFYTDKKKNVVTIKSDGTVLLNDLEIFLPHTTASFSVLQPSETYIIVQAAFGLQMQIQVIPTVQLYISMENSEKRNMRGLCGNFNYMEGDDFKTSGGLVEATASAFANTWKAKTTCNDVSESLVDPCSFNVETKKYAEHWCSLLEEQESPFAICHSTISPVEYVKRCYYDTCNCRNSEVCMCAALSSYVRACAAKGIILWGWRNGTCDKDIVTCPSSQIYLYNLTTSQPTCRSLSLGEKHSASEFTAVDGCGCPSGQYLNERHKCVPISQCSCYYNGMYLDPYEVIYRQEERCSCYNGKLICTIYVNETCPPGKIYFDCNIMQEGAANIPVYKSCQTRNIEYFETECISGCVCPEGLLDNGNDECVPEDKCPCIYNEVLIPHGRKVKVDCNTCLCQRGLWNCTNTGCYGMCTVYGNGHYITFDNKFYDFDGNCEFVAAQDYCGTNNDIGNFRVITENVPCGTTGVTCSKSIKVFLGSTELKLADKHLEETLGELSERVNYQTREVGIYLVIEAKTGILLIWDRKTTIFIKVSPIFKGKVCGLCGNFDDNANNDFITSHRLQVNDVLDFGNSWRLHDTCPDVTKVILPCALNPYRGAWAQKKCDLIKSEVFKACHAKVDPKPFYEACVNDVCSCDSGGDCDCFCTAVAVYAQECTKADVCVHWRTPDICPIFCDFYNSEHECKWHYYPCGKEVLTCHYLSYSNVSISYLEGCYPNCPPEMKFYDERSGKCVQDCGCYINNTHYRYFQTVPSTKSCEECVCDLNGNLSCSPTPDCFTTISSTTAIVTTTPMLPTTTAIPTSSVTFSKPTNSETSHCFCWYNNQQYKQGLVINSRVVEGTLCYNLVCDKECGLTKELASDCEPATPPYSSTGNKSSPELTTPRITASLSNNTSRITTVTHQNASTAVKNSTSNIPPSTFVCPELKNNSLCATVVCNGTSIEIVKKKCDPLPKYSCTNGREPVQVYDADQCCWHWECDCECTVWGDPHFLTFDGTYYGYQGNCTYILVEEIIKQHYFAIYIDNYYCGERIGVSCPRNITIRYLTQEVKIVPTNFVSIIMQVHVNGRVVLLPYVANGMEIYKTGLKYVVRIPSLKVNVTYNGVVFSVQLPYAHFGNNTAGQCGTCNNNTMDDCTMPSGKSDCIAMADSWIVQDLLKPECASNLGTTVAPKITVNKPCVPSPLCELIKGVTFSNCHKIQPPEHFYEACIFDSCSVPNSNIECSTLQQYASICADRGVCIEWRSNATACTISCPAPMVYKACGPAVPKTCRTTLDEEVVMRTDRRLVEGCFCPEGTMPFSLAVDVCVAECGCVGPDNIPRKFNERFEFDCQDCICLEGGRSINCTKHQCMNVANVLCTLEGFYPMTQISTQDKCCNETVCRCDPGRCNKSFPICEIGYEIFGSIPEGHCCPNYTCRLRFEASNIVVPKRVCIHENAEYQPLTANSLDVCYKRAFLSETTETGTPGSQVYSSSCQRCVCLEHGDLSRRLEISCTPVNCNISCPQGFELKNDSRDCCGICQQTHCVIKYGGTYQLMKPGDIVPSMTDNCTLYNCSLINDQFITSISQKSCPPFFEEDCMPGTIQISPDGCCKTCISNVCNLQEHHDYLIHNDCNSKEKVNLSSCEGSCGTFSMYSAAANSMLHKCTCCQELTMSVMNVQMQCSNGSLINHEYIKVETCGCKNTECAPFIP